MTDTGTQQTETVTATPASKASGPARDTDATWWWVRWAMPGLAVGVLLGAGGTALIHRAAARQGAGPPREEPRQELIDL